MKPQDLHDELKIREKIQGYKTPVQDSDWQKMLALLENDTNKGSEPLPETPTPVPGPAPITHPRRYLLLFLLGLLTIGGWATVAGLWPGFLSPGPDTRSVGPEQPGTDRNVAHSPHPLDSARLNTSPAENNPELAGALSSENGALHSTHPPVGNRVITANPAPHNTAKPETSSRANQSEPSRGVNGQLAPKPYNPASSVGSNSENAAPTGQTSPSAAVPSGSENAAPSVQTSPSAAVPSGSENAAPTGQTSPSSAALSGSENAGLPTPELPFWQDLAALFPLPQVKTELTLPPVRPDTIIRPATQLPRKPRRFQRGLVLGGNLNVVNYETGRLSIMPQLGYHWSVPVRSGYRFQAEVQLKYVTHYQQRTQFFYVSPGGSLDIRWEMDNLFFIEMPLLLKQENREIGKMAWFAGVKPAWCKPIFPYGSNTSSSSSGSGLSPSVFLRLSDGVRAFDLGFVFGTEWRFARRWSLDLRYNQGFLDLTHDNFFKNTTTHLNSDVQVTLHHYIHPYKRNRHAKHTLFPEPHRDH